MMYYGLIKNRLGNWCVFTRGENKHIVREELVPFEKAGFPLERIKIMKAL